MNQIHKIVPIKSHLKKELKEWKEEVKRDKDLGLETESQNPNNVTIKETECKCVSPLETLRKFLSKQKQLWDPWD